MLQTQQQNEGIVEGPKNLKDVLEYAVNNKLANVSFIDIPENDFKVIFNQFTAMTGRYSTTYQSHFNWFTSGDYAYKGHIINFKIVKQSCK